MPFFSIIIPSYNRSTQLISTLSSILSQQFTDYEIIIVDDGSTDNTKQQIADLHNDKIRYYKTENQERALARNFGLEQSRGQYVNYFDSDDIMYPDRFQRVFDFIQQNNHPEVLFTHYDIVDSEGKIIAPMKRFYTSFTEDLFFNNFLSMGAVFLQRSVALNYRFHTDRKIITAEDWELWLRLHVSYDFKELRYSTFGLTQHQERSLVTISLDRIVEREAYFAALIGGNQNIVNKFGLKAVNSFQADRFTFTALAYLIAGRKKKSLYFLFKSLLNSPRVLYRKRFWAIVKKLLLP